MGNLPLINGGAKMEYWIVILVVAVFSALAGHSAAFSKGLDSNAWAIVSFFFGPLALLALAATRADEFKLMDRRIKEGRSKVCPTCAEAMRSAALICPHCSSEQPAEG